MITVESANLSFPADESFFSQPFSPFLWPFLFSWAMLIQWIEITHTFFKKKKKKLFINFVSLTVVSLLGHLLRLNVPPRSEESLLDGGSLKKSSLVLPLDVWSYSEELLWCEGGRPKKSHSSVPRTMISAHQTETIRKIEQMHLPQITWTITFNQTSIYKLFDWHWVIWSVSIFSACSWICYWKQNCLLFSISQKYNQIFQEFELRILDFANGITLHKSKTNTQQPMDMICFFFVLKKKKD